MTEEKACPKCGNKMAQGKILKTNEYTIRNQYMYVLRPMMSPAPIFPKCFLASRFQNHGKPWLHSVVKAAVL